MTNTIEQIVEIEKKSGIESILVKRLIQKADPVLLSEFITQRVQSWDDWTWSSDYISLEPEVFSRLSLLAKEKVMEAYAKNRNYESMLDVAGKDVALRADLLIAGSEYFEKKTEEEANSKEGFLSIYFAHLSGNKKKLRQAVEKQYGYAMKGRFLGTYGNFDLSFRKRHCGMEDIADIFELTGFHEEAKKVRTRILEYLETDKWCYYSRPKDVEPPQITLQQILSGKADVQKNSQAIVFELSLGLYLRTARKLGYAKELHPRGVELFIAANKSRGNPSYDRILGGLKTINREEACCSANQVQKLKDLLLEVYLKDCHDGHESTRSEAAKNYPVITEVLQNDEIALDRIAIASLPNVNPEQQEVLLDGIRTAYGRKEAFTYLVKHKLLSSDPLISPEKLVRFVDGVTAENKDLIQQVLGCYECEKDLGINHAETFARAVGMTERAEAYQMMKELAGVK